MSILKSIRTASALIIFILAAQTGNAAAPQPVQDVVASIENHYREVQDLSAKVTQKNFLKAVGKTQTFEGTLWIKKPGKLRLDYTNGQVLLVDGKSALFYSKKSAQLIKKTFPGIQEMNIPVAFLLGAAHIRDDFDVLQPDPKEPRSLELLPKKKGAAMKKLSLQSDEVGRITGLTIFDRSGNTTELLFTGMQEGVRPEDRLFEFKAPKGTEIIEQ
jgi:outer membrane lipoprotein carrier protein